MEKQYTSRLLIRGNEIEIAGSLIKDRLDKGDVYLFIVHLTMRRIAIIDGLEVRIKPPFGYIMNPQQSDSIKLPELSIDSPKVHLAWRFQKQAHFRGEENKSSQSSENFDLELVLKTASSVITEIVTFE
ncbi:MAG: hypothetical protein ACTSP4_07190 [Candidatus Hodarchaeales archaeon]